MKTELIIKLNSEDCKKIQNDLERLEKVNGLNSETYLLYNKIKGFSCPYTYIEDEE